jgi:MoaA/NifB/PqqE/SkfB family radical SAM enzyme
MLMIGQLTWRILTGISPRLLWKVGFNLCWKGLLNIRRFERQSRENGSFFPAFMMISLTSRCNYSCQGCWVDTTQAQDLPLSLVQQVIDQCRQQGSTYFGLMGGEPLLYPGLLDLFKQNPDCYFQLFTNGAFLTKEFAQELRRAGNVSPLISIEGMEQVSEQRRGAKNVYASAVEALTHCTQAKLMTGVAASICQSNFNELVQRDFVRQVIDKGAHYLWYYIYRPVGQRPCPEMALTRDQILSLRRFLVDIRLECPIVIIDTYWDAQGRAVCPGAMGLSHHLSPGGYLEFCPPVQFSKDHVSHGQDFAEQLRHSEFLAGLRQRTAAKTRGCIFMEDPQVLLDWVQQEKALDSSGRGTAYDELSAMQPCASHHLAGQEIPERSWLYRLAKRYWFFGFGAYG